MYVCVEVCTHTHTHTKTHVYVLVDKCIYVHVAYVLLCCHLFNDDVSMLS